MKEVKNIDFKYPIWLNTCAIHKFCTPLTMVAPEPRQKIPTADIKDQTNLSLEQPQLQKKKTHSYIESSAQLVIGALFTEITFKTQKPAMHHYMHNRSRIIHVQHSRFKNQLHIEYITNNREAGVRNIIKTHG